MLTGGQVADCVAGEALIELMPDARLLNGDEGYDSNAIRRQSGHDAEHPAKSQSALEKLLLTRALPKPERHERMFCRLKDFRRVATRSDRLATNFLAAVCIAAIVSYWL